MSREHVLVLELLRVFNGRLISNLALGLWLVLYAKHSIVVCYVV